MTLNSTNVGVILLLLILISLWVCAWVMVGIFSALWVIFRIFQISCHITFHTLGGAGKRNTTVRLYGTPQKKYYER